MLWSTRNLHTLLLGVQDGKSLGKLAAVVKNIPTLEPRNSTSKHVPKGNENIGTQKTYTRMFIASLLLMVKPGNNLDVCQQEDG